MRALRSALVILVGVVMWPTWFPSAEEHDSTGEDDLGEVLSGFDEDSETVSADSAEAFQSPAYEFDGSVGLSTTYNYAQDRPGQGETDYRGFSRLRGQLTLELAVRLPRDWLGRIGGHAYYDAIYSLHGRDAYSDELLRASEDEVELDEVYLEGLLTDNLDIKTGRQIAVWGKSDNIRVTDILNPLDRREPGVVDIEHLRLPVGMTRVDYYFGDWNLCALLVHEVRFSKRPAFGSDFAPSSAALPPEQEPATALKNTQYGAALNGIAGKWDLAFYAAEVFDDTWHRVWDSESSAEVRRHSRMRMVGAAASLAAGNWLLKSEVALFDRLRFSADPDRTRRRYDVLGGVEYRGISDTVISLEAANRHVIGFDEGMSAPPDRARADEFESALRLIRDHMHDSLRLGYLMRLSGMNGRDGGFQRLWSEYDMSDTVELTAGIVDYRAGDVPPYDTIGDNDRVFVELGYSF